jgi:2-dehydro-3-deoxyglucarate aldolase
MAVSAVKYPPKGNRGAGLYRAQGYSTNFNEYRRWVEDESVVIVQIEHIQAVENMESILTTEGIDAFIVGPYDLSASLGVPGEFDCPDVKSALNEIQRIATKLKCTAAGYHVVPPDAELVTQKIKEGFTFIAYSVDFLLLGEMCKKGLFVLR